MSQPSELCLGNCPWPPLFSRIHWTLRQKTKIVLFMPRTITKSRARIVNLDVATRTAFITHFEVISNGAPRGTLVSSRLVPRPPVVLKCHESSVRYSYPLPGTLCEHGTSEFLACPNVVGAAILRIEKQSVPCR